MKQLLRAEYVALFLLSIYLFSTVHYPWWWYPALFLLPDIGMVGYLINSRIGAWTYNATHFLGLAALLIAAGIFLDTPILFVFGTVVLGHIALDRALGYGLKYEDSFKHTHMGNL
jgi:hypothetical protein